MIEKIRDFQLEDARRQVRLDKGTWDAVDWIAAQQGVKWADLARRWVSENKGDADVNLTAVIRAGAIAELLARELRPKLARATAVATKPPGVIRVDWVSNAAHGGILLDYEGAKTLAQTLEIARLNAGVDALEAWGESEQDREMRYCDEDDAKRKAELEELRTDELKKEERAAERRRVDNEAEESTSAQE